MRVREVTEKDCKEVSKMHLAAYKKSGKGMVPLDYLNDKTDEENLSRWEKRVANRNVLSLLIEDDSKILGCSIVINFNLKDDTKKERAELKFTHVHVDYWDRGIEKELVLSALKILLENGYHATSSWVLNADHREKELYSSLGAEEAELGEAVLSPTKSHPDGLTVPAIRYVIKDISKVLSEHYSKETDLAATLVPKDKAPSSSHGFFAAPISIEESKPLSGPTI